MRIRFWQHVDYMLLALVAGLALYGVVMVHSATCSPSCDRWIGSTGLGPRQLLYVAAGSALMVLAATINHRLYRTFAYLGYLASLGLLGLVLVVGRGDAELGVRRWIPLGFVDFQPSEVAKVLFVIALARLLSDRQGNLSFRRIVLSVGLLLPEAGLVYLQPDLGTTLSFAVIWLGMVVVAGIRPLHLGFLALGAAIALPASWFVLRDYQKHRLETFLTTLTNPEADPFGEGYNIIQSRISIGSGGMFGRGWLQGTQTQLDYLRVKQSDFIFSVVAEEMGFIGTALLMLLFILLLFRVVRAAERSRDEFARLTCFGVASMLLFQSVVNMAANLTLIPVTGVPLPLVSFGGSAMVAFFAAFGIVQGIAIRSARRSLSWIG
ncbi:MAG: rod shape-determining protein RodA [Chloroflexota bacterium]